MSTYHLRVTDRAGCSFYAEAADFAALLVHAHSFARRLPGDVIDAYNDNLLDCDTNGLTEEEREQLDEAVEAGRELAKVAL